MPFLSARRVRRCATTLCAITVALVTNSASAFDFSDTSVSYRYLPRDREPGVAGAVTKQIYAVTHVDGYKYGSNFFNVDFLISGGNDIPAGGGGGAHEVYGIYRHTLSLSKVSGMPMSYGVVRDLGLTAGVDISGKNTAFAPGVFKLMLGPTVSFDVPGFFDFGVWFYHERNHNGITGPAFNTGVAVNFDSTYILSAAWGLAVPIPGPVPVKFNGFITYTGKKGKDGFGNQTQPETLSNIMLMADVGAPAGKKDVFFVGLGIQYWNNKFGNDANLTFNGGTKVFTPFIRGEVHF